VGFNVGSEMRIFISITKIKIKKIGKDGFECARVNIQLNVIFFVKNSKLEMKFKSTLGYP